MNNITGVPSNESMKNAKTIFPPTSMMSQFQDEKLAKLMQTCDVEQVY